MKPTYEELEKKLYETEKELNETKRQLKETQELLKLALERIIKLEEQINKNSKNSSKPPSLDQKPNTPDSDTKEKKAKSGTSRNVLPPERVDQHVKCTLENCTHCGSKNLSLRNAVEAFQQIELPEIRAIVTEYILEKYQCNDCQKRCSAKLPEGVPFSAFGLNMMSLVATLTGRFLMPKRDAIQLIKDLYDIDIGLGSVPNIEERVAKALHPICERIQCFILENKFCSHFDETGWRDCGKRHFAWIACNKEASLFKIYRSRGRDAFDKLVKNRKEFNAVTDRYPVYKNLQGVHQYCLAHLIRDFQKYAERAGPDKIIGETVVNILRKACKVHRNYFEKNRTLGSRNQALGQLKRTLDRCFFDALCGASEDLANLCDKLSNESGNIWAFMKTEGMDPTNNLAERNIRNLVIRRKRSYGTRSNRGKEFIEIITSICVTAKQQKINVYTFIKEAVSKYYSRIEAPYIKPVYGF